MGLSELTQDWVGLVGVIRACTVVFQTLGMLVCAWWEPHTKALTGHHELMSSTSDVFNSQTLNQYPAAQTGGVVEIVGPGGAVKGGGNHKRRLVCMMMTAFSKPQI